ncbi:MAG: response regulator [Pseudomonadales bacterium]|nr:response regulator [Pseudomonadales bacterium]
MLFPKNRVPRPKIIRDSTFWLVLTRNIFFGFILCLFSSFSNATINFITDQSSDQNYDNTAYVSAYFFLDNASLTISEILEEEYQQQFKLNTSFPINFGFTRSTVWLKITYQDKRTTPHEKDIILGLSNPILDHIEIYRPSEKGLTPYKTGALEDYEQREIKNNGFFFYLPPAGIGPVTLYLKISSQSPLIIPLEIRSMRDAFISGNLITHGSHMLVAMLFLMIGYNVLLSFTLRDLEQYYYLIWYSIATICVSLLMGIAQPYLGSYGVWLTANLWGLGSWAAAFFLLHAGAYVRLKNIHPALNKVNLILFSIFAINGLFIFTTDYRLWQWTLFVCGICGIITPVIISYGIYLKQRMGWLGITVFSPTFIGLVIYILASANIIQNTWFSLNAAFIGIVLTGITIAITAGTKTNEEKTKRLKLETSNRKALEINNELLKKTNAVKDAFLSTISHELRTPLNGASGALALLEGATQQTAKESNTIVPEEIESLFKVISRSVNEMIGLINSIIGFSELHIEDTKVSHDYFSPYHPIISLIELRKNEIKESNIEVYLDIESLRAIEIESDEEKYKKIISNIFDNALKFTQSGRITIRGRIEKPDTGNARLVISITDTGVGISQTDIESIMEPFSQVDQSYTRQYGGLGIGLAVCKKTMGLMGGEIKITSELDEGTCVQLIFDIVGFKTVEIVEDKNDKTTSNINLVTDLHVLVVEDNKTNQLITQQMLKKMGANPVLAENGAVAVDVFKEQEIDLVLMDCQMPVMDGFEATRQIRGLATDHKMLPIIAITANTSEKDQRKCKECGMNDFLAKPISYDTLSITIEKWAKKAIAANNRA